MADITELQAQKRAEKLASVHRLEEERLTQKRANALGLPYIDLSIAPIDLDSLVIIPEKRARQGKLAILQKIGQRVHIAVYDPQDPETQSIIREFTDRGLKVNLLLASESSLEKAWRLYELYEPVLPSVEDVFIIPYEVFKELISKITDIQSLAQEIETSGSVTTELLNRIFIGALKGKATDIHFEPSEGTVRLRYRIDGVLQDIASFSKENYPLVLSRIKILAGLKLNLRNVNQDGRFAIRIEGKKAPESDIDIRVSILPGGQGETIVLRLLGMGVGEIELEELGMAKEQVEFLKAQISKPNGMILTTGPTGSGKTTTLYACLKKILNPEKKIITIENPIEYQIPGITQTQVDEEEGYTFEKGLAAIVRQDPDVIMIGEIRTTDSANMSVNAALTGHLVFSTLHTNDAVGAIPRLQNLGVDKTLIPSAINGVIAQRLVRKLCPHCRVSYNPSTRIREAISRILSLISPKAKITPPEIGTLYRPRGCPKCFGTGYIGRTGIFEILSITDVIEAKIMENATTYELRKTAIEQGMLTLLQHGILKVLAGITSLEEVKRVAGDARYLETLYGQAILSLLARELKIKRQIRESLTPQNLKPEVLAQSIKAAPLEDIIHWTIAAAYRLRANDIHIEPRKQNFKIKFRIDGILHEIATLPQKLFVPLMGEIKELAGLKIGLYQEIQEGRLTVIMDEKSFDVRVSIIPSGYGETAALRLLRPEIAMMTLEELGLQPKIYQRLLLELQKPHGIILATGPTGCGKSTTLYGIIKKLNTGEKKIITIENPIEYKIEGIIQTQIDEEKGYDFATALKSLLRQDPDIMMVGEVRDFETAQITVQAALTGHLMFSTVHTNDAASTVQRLVNLGVSAADIATVLNAAIAERLIRKLCPKCKKPYQPDKETLTKIKEVLKDLPAGFSRPWLDSQFKLYKAEGCMHCGWIGYYGQTGIFEAIFFDEELKQMVAQGSSAEDIKRVAYQKGTLSLLQDGLLKVLQGVTSLDEIKRVLGGISP